MNPVIGVGAPWYTSGIQEWNGTAPTLNSRPTASSATPANAIESSVRAANASRIPGKVSVPVAPYSNATP
ncbi:Uncharacterised protein [Mycobacterium tuberculosis]|uniref:Uncharacterized protein n=1 Tax=Mycobacterium tuberculosis TaxID=1773 RepID=A0A655FH49_MYCTX|nr:Uncharacterised protein [Mycobacterium tuberculosis]CFR65051.1 Uncharacterised protein [Mycobacterium tuberculosis]CKS64592.1 Uncharacterised protein [Mycobacterium tuberculosis]CKT43769.1 Uncharacterised protein [Mycobacterium tuberculosis]CKW38287.1 Uncharacterised protein [Mycobacterium tuberculosis]